MAVMTATSIPTTKSELPMANEMTIKKKPPQSVGFVPERLLHTDEAAAIIQIHPRTLQRFAREGMIRGIHIGKLWRFRASEIEEWIQRQTA
jgi:excisionase family DNA binding protein